MNRSAACLNDTIAAIASAPGPAARGILRISGATALGTVLPVLTGPLPEIHLRQAKRYPCLVGIDNHRLQLPANLYVWPTHRSFTGEPLVEIHCVGSPPLLNEILERLFTSGARPAERGEFTLRAFLAGRIDLVQAEAVLGVIDADNQDQLQTALDQLAGGISSKIASIREELLLHLADLEAGLDFVEEDLDFVQRPAFLERLHASAEFLKSLLEQASTRMLSTGSYHVVLGGLPNAGKSRLFNALLQTETAIVSPIAGTTRDYLSAEVRTVQGIRYKLIDTAGWESPRDGIELIAGTQREEQYIKADLIVWCSAANQTAIQAAEDVRLMQEYIRRGSPVLPVLTKADTLTNGSAPQGLADANPHLAVSAIAGTGLDRLQQVILQHLSTSRSDAEVIGATAARCRESLVHALSGVQRAKELVDLSAGDELVALELRDVLDHLGRIVGAVYTDDILDRIFSRFCIGK